MQQLSYVRTFMFIATIFVGISFFMVYFRKSVVESVLSDMRDWREPERLEVLEIPRKNGHHVARDMTPQNPKTLAKFRQLAGPNRKQDDPKLIQFIREDIIEDRRPFKPKLSNNLYQTPQAEEVEKIFNKKKNGFFVEAGGLDGERSSNTIWFEKQFGWTGFLAEMDPSYYLQLRGKNRMCSTANACISPKPYSTMVPYKEERGGNGAIASKANKNTMDCMCFPFYSMMLAINKTKIDFLSLDVEGAEYDILKTIPFDKLDISVLSVEYLHTDKLKLKSFMESQGYTVTKTLSYANPAIAQWSFDYIFVKNGFQP